MLWECEPCSQPSVIQLTFSRVGVTHPNSVTGVFPAVQISLPCCFKALPVFSPIPFWNQVYSSFPDIHQGTWGCGTPAPGTMWPPSWNQSMRRTSLECSHMSPLWGSTARWRWRLMRMVSNAALLPLKGKKASQKLSSCGWLPCNPSIHTRGHTHTHSCLYVKKLARNPQCVSRHWNIAPIKTGV